MTLNPGGRLAIQDIVGRTREISRYWRVLERQSLVLGAERRLGKTHLVLKMQAEGHPGFVMFYQELEKVHGVVELVRSLYTAVRDYLPRLKKMKARAVEAWASLLPKRIGALDLPQARESWKDLLAVAAGDVLEAVGPEHRVVLIWDELPLMLSNIHAREGAETAIELLDLLRYLRQTHGARLRFLFTGSIGLHLILRSLRAAGHTNAPINDMLIETVPPMRPEEAEEVAMRALRTLDNRATDEAAMAAAIAGEIGGYPYFIHHVVDQLSLLDRAPTLDDVPRAIRDMVFHDSDPAQFSYFVERLPTHYLAGEDRRALAILDALASEPGPIPLEQVLNLARQQEASWTDEELKGTCQLLRQDHYLALESRDRGGLWGFRWPLLKRWWEGSRR